LKEESFGECIRDGKDFLYNKFYELQTTIISSKIYELDINPLTVTRKSDGSCIDSRIIFTIISNVPPNELTVQVPKIKDGDIVSMQLGKYNA
jgi:hypothetical protein